VKLAATTAHVYGWKAYTMVSEKTRTWYSGVIKRGRGSDECQSGGKTRCRIGLTTG
jgi:hypothetical protein